MFCQVCSDFLEKASTFMINSLNVEQKIKNYYESSKSQEQIDLFNVLEFAFPKIEMDSSQIENDGHDEDTNFNPTDLLEIDEQKTYEQSLGIKQEPMKPRP